MDDNKDTICPWCQSEIVWDSEIGPEELCPHCWNELGGYRSVNLSILSPDTDEDLTDVDDEDEDEVEDHDWEAETTDSYGEIVQQCIDEQEDAPECASCHEFLLLAGRQTVDGTGYVSNEPAAIGGPFLKPPYNVNVFLCPSCFRFEYMLEEKGRLDLIEKFKQ